MEAVDVIKSIKWHRQMPWNVQSETLEPPQRSPEVRPGEENLPVPGRAAYAIAAVLRLFVSGALTSVIAATFPQSMNPLVSFMVGLGALSAVQQAVTLVPLVVKNVGQAALGGIDLDTDGQRQAVQPGWQSGAAGSSAGAKGVQTDGNREEGLNGDADVTTHQDPPDLRGAK